MYRSDARLLGDAILCGIANRYEREMALNSEDGSCSEAHIDAMLGLIRSSNLNEKKRSRGRLIAALVAAALLLVGCTAYVYRKQIGSFVETIFDEWIRVDFEDDSGEYINVIEDVYELSFIPEGYELDVESVDDVGVTYIYYDENNNFIMYDQTPLGASNTLDIDNDTNEVSVFEHNEIEIYVRVNETTRHYIWRDENYMMSLVCSNIIQENEVLKIIDGIK